MSKVDEAVLNAEREIVNILRQLEESTGWTVDDLGIQEDDVTTLHSSVPLSYRRVEIRMRLPTERRWQA